MSSIYTPTPIEHGNYVLPSDGDPAVAESVNQALRDLADSALRANDNSDAALTLASQAINGTTGGTYHPAADIFIAGPGGFVFESAVTISGSGSFVVFPTAQFIGAIVATGTVSVSGNASFSGLVSFTDTTSLAEAVCAELSVTGETTLGNSITDALTVRATSTFTGQATFENNLTADDAAEFNSTLTANGNVTLGTSAANQIEALGQLFLHSRLRYSDTGYVPYRAPTLLPDSSATLNIEDGDVFVIRPGVTASRFYSLSNSHAVAGARVMFASLADQALDNAVSIGGAQTVSFAAGDRICCVEFVYLTDMDDRADGWWPMRKDTK